MSKGIKYGDYFLLGRLSEGGMAEIFLGKPLVSENKSQLIAVKRIIKQYQSNPNFIAMLKDEARIAIALKHPNICRVFELGQFNKQLFLVMEFIHGKELGSILYQSVEQTLALPFEFSLYIIAQIASALGYAHKKADADGKPEEIVHRDVNPQNIFISFDGSAKLIDFGIAKAKDRLTRTKLGMVKGKCGYMSPEQVAGENVDGRSDIFALGVVLYELLTGKQAFVGKSEFDIFQNIAATRYIPPQTANKNIPESVALVMDKSLAQNREDRYQDADEFSQDLFSLLESQNLNPEVLQSNLSEYIKNLYRESYEKEIEQIKSYEGIIPPKTDLPIKSPSTLKNERISGVTVPEMLVYNPDDDQSQENEPIPEGQDEVPEEIPERGETHGETIPDMPVYTPSEQETPIVSHHSFDGEPTVPVDTGRRNLIKQELERPITIATQDFEHIDFDEEATRKLEENNVKIALQPSAEVAKLPTREHHAHDDSVIPTGVIQTTDKENIGIGLSDETIAETPFNKEQDSEDHLQKQSTGPQDSNDDFKFSKPKMPIQTMKIQLPTEEEAMAAIKSQSYKEAPRSTEEIAFSSQDISFLPSGEIQTISKSTEAFSGLDKKQALSLAVAFTLGGFIIGGVYYWFSIH